MDDYRHCCRDDTASFTSRRRGIEHKMVEWTSLSGFNSKG
jgi:hypothetical protein